MSKVWEFFENMNEAVYASDVDTYELLYLNKAARDLFQFKDESDYKGKNCYEILQQCSSPCAMCTNNRLKPGVFYEWSRFNPLVRRSYLLKDTMVIDDGRRVRIEMAIDLDIHELAKRSFSEFTDNEALINEGLRCALAEETPNALPNLYGVDYSAAVYDFMGTPYADNEVKEETRHRDRICGKDTKDDIRQREALSRC